MPRGSQVTLSCLVEEHVRWFAYGRLHTLIFGLLSILRSCFPDDAQFTIPHNVQHR
jgi:hypothetical protein